MNSMKNIIRLTDFGYAQLLKFLLCVDPQKYL